MADTKERTATYKGKTYRLLFLGDTKFGRRAKLGFQDGSKEFWVPAAEVEASGGAATPARTYTGNRSRDGAKCAACGRGGPLVQDLEDGLMKHKRCCDMES